MSKRINADDVASFCQAAGRDPEGARARVALAEQVFGSTAHLHGLTKTSRPLLQLAALLRAPASESRSALAEPAAVATLLRDRRPELTPTQCGIVTQAVAAREAAGGDEGDGPVAQVAARLDAVLRVAEGLWWRDVEIAGVVDDGHAVDILIEGDGAAEWDPASALEGAARWNALMPRPIRSIARHDGSAPVPGFLQPRMRAGDAVRAIIQRQLEQFTSRDYGLPYEEDIEYVHEMRVALRRLRAALRLFKKMLLPAARALSAELKWFARALGEVRDRDVFLKFLRDYRGQAAAQEQAPLVDRLLETLLAQRRQHCGQLLDVFGSERYQAFRGAYVEMAGRPVGAEEGFVRACKSAGRTVRRQARRRLRERLDRVTYYGRRLERLTPEEQHLLRIDCKRLRYAGEFFAELYAGRLSEIVKPTVRLQDALGDVHDADVYGERIDALCAEAEGADGGAVEALRAHLARWREESMSAAAAAWRAFTKPKALRRLAKILNSPLKG